MEGYEGGTAVSPVPLLLPIRVDFEWVVKTYPFRLRGFTPPGELCRTSSTAILRPPDNYPGQPGPQSAGWGRQGGRGLDGRHGQKARRDFSGQISTQVGSDEREQVVQAVTGLVAQLESATYALRRVLSLVGRRAQVQVNLTPREMQTLGQLVFLRSNGEIAREFGVSENTVKFHMKNVFRKLGVRNRGQATMIAQGMVLDLTRSRNESEGLSPPRVAQHASPGASLRQPLGHVALPSRRQR